MTASEPDGHTPLRQRFRHASPALKFVLMVGIMSFFADFTYEGSRSIIGPYLGTLGVGALGIAIITGPANFSATGSAWYPAAAPTGPAATGPSRSADTWCRWPPCRSSPWPEAGRSPPC